MGEGEAAGPEASAEDEERDEAPGRLYAAIIAALTAWAVSETKAPKRGTRPGCDHPCRRMCTIPIFNWSVYIDIVSFISFDSVDDNVKAYGMGRCWVYMKHFNTIQRDKNLIIRPHLPLLVFCPYRALLLV